MTLSEKIITIRVELQKSKIKKSGKNKNTGVNYYELSDFLPTLNELMLKHKVNDQLSLDSDLATLEIVNAEEPTQTALYSIPFKMFEVPKTKNGSPMMQEIQYLGALNTYIKRYLYLNAFGITDGEVIDAIDNSELSKEETNNLLKDKIARLYEEKKPRLDDKLKERVEQVIISEEVAAYAKTIKHLESL